MRMGRPVEHVGCSVEGCPRKHYAKGFCSTHYQRWRRWGNPEVLLRALKGTGDPKNIRPYKNVWQDGKCVRRSHAVWEAYAGFPVPEGFQLDHINGDQTDDRIENLACMIAEAHLSGLWEKHHGHQRKVQLVTPIPVKPVAVKEDNEEVA